MSGYAVYQKIENNITSVIKGNKRAIRMLLSGFASGGHILLEDVPGSGKTTLAKTLALSVAADFKRIQFTPDLLPSDISGVSIFDPKEKQFRLHKGPVFTNILLADEINRASPRTQSALLEAMAEHQVSIDGKVLVLKKLFFVVATQNQVESRGTYPLPEAQMDRFAMKLSLGYVNTEDEVSVLSDQEKEHPIDRIQPCVSMEDIFLLMDEVKKIYISDELKKYIVLIVQKTRTFKGILLGAGPRASLTLMKTAKALALFDQMEFVTPDHIQELAAKVLGHRLVLDPEARYSGVSAESVVEEIIRSVKAPA